MKTDKIFWGILLVFIGGVFLLENFGLINFSWYYIWRFWPVLLVLIGVNILFSRTNSRLALIATVLITVVTLSFVAVKGLQHRGERANWSWNFSEDDNNSTDTVNVEKRLSFYEEDYDAKYKSAVLNIKGGASVFEIKNTTTKLFESNLKETNTRYYLRKTNTESNVVLDFNTKNKGNRYTFNDNQFSEVKMMLNTNPVWDINLAMGAGKVDFDLTPYKIKNLNLKGGAASFNLKMGSLFNDVNINAETGVAEVKIEIPEEIGCQIRTSTGLSSKDFDGFEKKSDGTYETSNYKLAAKKMNITLKGGLSDFEVSRYK